MELPTTTKLDIDGLTYLVTFTEDIDGGKNLGTTDFIHQSIRIDKDQCYDQQMITLMHEVGHIFWNELIVYANQNTKQGQELFCDRFGALMFRFLRDNKKFINEYILGDTI
jgi:hypothetical protein